MEKVKNYVTSNEKLKASVEKKEKANEKLTNTVSTLQARISKLVIDENRSRRR